VRALVVGGAGFIGSHLVDRLLVEGHRVDVVDDLSSGSLGNLAAARAAGGELKIHHLDACAPELAPLVAMREPEVVFHLGWGAPGRVSPEALGRAVQSTLNVLEAARLHAVTKVVTSLPAAALHGEVPARELPVKEGRPWEPLGGLGVIARAVAELLGVYRARHDVEFTALALAEVYGSRQRVDGGLVAALRAARDAGASVGPPRVDPRHLRDLLFIDDAVDAFVRAATRGSGLVVNVGTGNLTSVRDLWQLIAGPGVALPVLAAPDPDEPARFSVSPTRARIHLAWAPWTDPATGVRALDERD